MAQNFINNILITVGKAIPDFNSLKKVLFLLFLILLFMEGCKILISFQKYLVKIQKDFAKCLDFLVQ